MAYEQTAAQAAAQLEAERRAEAATAALEPVAAAATQRLQALIATIEQAEQDAALGLSGAQRQTLRRTAQRLRAATARDGSATPAGYLTRSQFARLAEVSPNTLVKWHAAGSLVPAYTHPITHYRYYKPEQIAQVKHARQRRQRSR